MSARMSKQERDEARRRWRLIGKVREEMDAENAELDKDGLGTSDTQRAYIECVAYEPRRPRPGDGWDEYEKSEARPPATQFIVEQLKGVTFGDPQYGKKWQQAILDLVGSDIPLDPHNRALIARELRWRYLSDKERERTWRSVKRRHEADEIRWLKRHLVEDRGIAPGEADGIILNILGEKLGIGTVDGLNKRIGRDRRKGFHRTKK